MKRPFISQEIPAITAALPFGECIAKTYKTENGNIRPGFDVETHCKIVGSIARILVARMPRWLQDELFPPGCELVAAAHDIGKVSPAFQEMIHLNLNNPKYVPNSLPGLENANPEKAKRSESAFHAWVSQAGAQGLGKYIPEILGQHHGMSPSSIGLKNDGVYGGPAWQFEREKLLAELARVLNGRWPIIARPEQARVLAGLTTVADWIGSGSYFDNPKSNWADLIEVAVDNAGFIRPEIRQGLDFSDIFPFQAQKVQSALINAASQAGVYVLEAPMGSGKTEAALFVAYKAMELGQATGIYFALPTQLTSDKIHERVNRFLDKILCSDSAHPKAFLVHGSAWLRDTEMGEEGQPGKSWFNSNKRSILAPFAVGTIDQALMAAMNVKHGFVRAFGLAGKVVILDEVHSYDVYTSTIMRHFIGLLKELHCTVIILSATLTTARRRELLGLASAGNDRDVAYPLITALPKRGSLVEIGVEKIPDTEVRLHLEANDTLAAEEALSRAAQGQQVLWIENTVVEAQNAYRLLASRKADYGVECGLLHSRFLKCDREKNETLWVGLYGKDGANRQNQGRILVGTQVLEQSLDIDADFLVTRLCPVDMFFQRIGRLWRHWQNDALRPRGTKREAWLLSARFAEIIEAPETSLGRSGYVYLPYVLCRSIEVLGKLSSLFLPRDIRPLLEDCYRERSETEEVMARFKHEVENGSKYRKGRATLERLALVGLSTGGTTQSDVNPTTRYSEEENIDVLLLKAKPQFKTDGVTQLTMLDGNTLQISKSKLDKKQWRQTAASLMLNTVKVAPHQAPMVIPIKQLEWLKDYVYLGNEDEECPFRVAVVDASGSIKNLNGGDASNTYQLTYGTEQGYRADKRAKGQT